MTSMEGIVVSNAVDILYFFICFVLCDLTSTIGAVSVAWLVEHALDT